MENNTSNNELMHYGVLGMKWGVHRGRAAQAYTKAVAKRQKLEKKVVKTKDAYEKAQTKSNSGVSIKYKKKQAKADKLQYKADKKKYGLFTNQAKAAELQKKADKAQYEADKYKYRAEKRENKEAIAKKRYLSAQRKAKKWINAMDKTFTNDVVSQISKETINAGKDYVINNPLLRDRA